MKNNTNEEIDKNLYSEKTLSLLNMKELRDMGRKFGVPSPTTLKKQDLIGYILKIVYGEINVPTRSNYGRPNKAQFDMYKYLEKIKSKKEISSELIKVKLDMDYGSLMVSDKSENYQNSSNIESRILCKSGEKYYLKKHQFVDSASDIEISSELVHKFNLEDLDVVEVIFLDNEFKIVTINGIGVQNGFQDIVIDGKPISGRNKQNFYFSTKEEISDTIKQLVDKCNELGIKTVIYSITNFENATYNISYDVSEENSKNYKKLVSMLDICEKLMRESEDIVMIFENIDDVESLIGSFEPQVASRIQKNLNRVVSKFVGLENYMISFGLAQDTIY